MRKKLLLTILVFSMYANIQAQCTDNVNIPDATFKNYLLNNTAINTVSDGEISCAEATAFSGILSIGFLGIADLTGIEAFVNITELHCGNNNLTSLYVSQNTELTTLICTNNDLTTLDVSGNNSFLNLDCSNNSLTSINVGGSRPNVFVIGIVQLKATGNPNLSCIEVDDLSQEIDWSIDEGISPFSTNCFAVASIADEVFNNTINIYPNPVNSTLTVTLDDIIEKISIYNIQGQEVLQTKSTKINVAQLSTGLFILKIVNEEGKIGVKRFIKE